MKKPVFSSILILYYLFFGFGVQCQSVSEIESHRIMLPNGWGITPVGKSLPLGDLPLNMAVSPSGKLIAVTNNGQSNQILQLIDVQEQAVIDTIVARKAWIGLAFSSDSKTLYASGGNDNWIMRFNISNRQLIPRDTLILDKPWPVKVCPSGIALDEKHHLLYTVTTENHSLYIINTRTKKVIGRYPMEGEGYACLPAPGEKILYISCWGCGKLLLFDTKQRKFTGSIKVGDHPNDMCITKDGSVLFIANSSDNSVSVIDLKKKKVIETLNAALYPDAPAGSTTNSVALDKTGKMLFIANADNNCLAVFDISNPGRSISKGFLPTGWYPTCVRVADNILFISNGKGFSSYPNPEGPNPAEKKPDISRNESETAKPRKIQYIGGLFRGTMSMIPVPDDKQLSFYSQVVYHNVPYTKEKEMRADGQPGNPVPMRTGDRSPIRYVFYIIKENRTYDQVLSDIPGGNGDRNLLLFGEKITPNQHALAKEFVLLDNFYCDGEVSADGHNWSMGAYATDFLEKNWPTSYGSRGGSYNAEGTREIANNKNGFIWDNCKRENVTYRTYGEFADDYKPNIPVLRDHFCPYFTSWDQSVPDTTRFRQWKRDFDSLIAAGQLPQLNTIRFINDHTQGLSKGKCTPFAQVADNDLAVGLFINHLSHSPVWKECAVFIVEDDAQNGPDHVDAHRTTAYLAGGFVKRHFIDHTPYSTSSMVRTIELILGLPPMSQYDAAATPMWRCFSEVSDETPFNALPAQVNLNERNTAMNKWQRMSEEFDFTREDRAPEDKLNEVLWIAIKGENSDCPPPVHSAFLKVREESGED